MDDGRIEIKLIVIWSSEIVSSLMNKIKILIGRLLNGECCSFKNKYGLYCPGCGATRALYRLVHLQIVESVLSNPVVILAVIDMVILIVLRVGEGINGKGKRRNYGVRAKVLKISLLIWIIFAIVRDGILVIMGYDYLGDISK